MEIFRALRNATDGNLCAARGLTFGGDIDTECAFFAQVLQARKQSTDAREQISMARTLAQDHDLAGHPAVILALSRLEHSEAAGSV